MESFSGPPSNLDLGDAWASWPRTYEDVVERSAGIELDEHLSPEDKERLSKGATELGIPDADSFLRGAVVRFRDISDIRPELSPDQLPEFIDQVLAAARDGAYS